MGMVVRTNTMSTNAYRQLGMNNAAVSKSLEKLSSGFRINRAGDDASGLAISEKMKSQIKGLEQASANAQDGISLVQTAEGALTEVHSMLNRMVELATKSANGTIQNEVDRDAIQTEVKALNEEISRIAKSTNFNGIQLLDGSLGGARTGALSSAATNVAGSTVGETAAVPAKYVSGALTYAADAATTITVAYTDASGAAQTRDITFTADTNAADSARAAEAAIAGDSVLGELFKATAGASGTGIAVETKTAGLDKGAITGITFKSGTGVTAVAAGSASAGVDTKTSITLGTDMAVGNTITLGGTTYELVANASDDPTTSGAVGFTDAPGLIAAAAKNGVTVTASALTSGTQITAVYDGSGGSGLVLQVGTTNDDFNKVTVKVDDLSANGLGLDSLDVSSAETAGAAINIINTAINKVSTNRGNLGALQNRLEYAINNLDTTAENMDAANSRIRDTDMAKEMMNYTKMNILTQAAQAMLAQANQQPQSILQLLQ